MRIGQGFDVHAFEEGDHLVLGGVSIPYHRAFKAHSDGDVLIHALCDALLGSVALGDIGIHFPDTSDDWKGANSRDLLLHVMTLIDKKGVKLLNADMTIMAQAPKMAPHIAAMRANLAHDMKVNIDQVSIKATTTEKLGFTGREEGIAASAIVLVDSKGEEVA
jgi:2-C-methyl-D-erythritol 2,4-cyclodiphosphate synthase